MTATHIEMTVRVPVDDIVAFFKNGGYTVADMDKFVEFCNTDGFKQTYGKELVESIQGLSEDSSGDWEYEFVSDVLTVPDGVLINGND